VTKFVPSSTKKVTKSEKYDIADNQLNTISMSPSYDEKVTKLRLSQEEKLTKLPNKKLQYLITILLLSGDSATIDEYVDVFSFKDRSFFRRNYIKPLESVGFITKTNPDKPTASNQKYVITEKGKRFLTGQEF